MKRNAELIEFVEKIYESEKIDVCDEFIGDVTEFVRNKPSVKKKVFPLLNKQLDAILHFSPYQLGRFNKNEVLKDMPFECYSLHAKGIQFNIRIIGTYIDDVFYMLVLFEERSGKRQQIIQRLNKKRKKEEKAYVNKERKIREALRII